MSDPYAVQRAWDAKEHRRKWDAAAEALNLDPRTRDDDEMRGIAGKYREIERAETRDRLGLDP